jgi:hypothetical protein
MLKRTPRRTFKTFTGHAPIVTIINTKLLHKRLLGCERSRRARALAKMTPRHDPVSYYPVPLPRSAVDRLAAKLRIEDGDDKPITDQEWRKLIGLIAAEAIKLAIKNKS